MYVWGHLKNSFKVGQRQKVGDMVGTDPFGNRYYELPAQPQLGKRRPTRWYDTKDTNRREVLGMSELWAGFDSNLPSEWESWLRHRRADPPTENEVLQSLALAQLKKKNAAKLEEERKEEMLAQGLDPGPPPLQDHEKTPYPKYEEFESVPGVKKEEQQDRWKDFKNPYSKQ